MLYSHIRVTTNKSYIRLIEERIAMLTGKAQSFDTPA